MQSSAAEDQTVVKKQPKVSKRLEIKSAVFELLQTEPDITAKFLQETMAARGVHLSLASAYRYLEQFDRSGGKIEETETQKVRLIASILQEADESEHLSAQDIIGRAALQGKSIEKTTVYRVLAKLTALQRVQAIVRGRQRLYEWKTLTTHAHLTCASCGKTIEFEQQFLEQVGRHVAAQLDFDYLGIEVVVIAHCSNCKH